MYLPVCKMKRNPHKAPVAHTVPHQEQTELTGPSRLAVPTVRKAPWSSKAAKKAPLPLTRFHAPWVSTPAACEHSKSLTSYLHTDINPVTEDI